MTSLSTPAPQVKSQDTSSERDHLLDHLLTAIRAGATRSRLISVELDSIGIALRQQQITCEQALRWANEQGLLSWIELGPEARS
jgi:hypothetical protein